jgi:hypothetical protein
MYLAAQPWAPAPTVVNIDVRSSAIARTDARNLIIIVAVWALLLLVLPPAHEYPIIDDWNHAASVRTMLAKGTFEPPPTMQANLFGLTVWGAAWSKLFGFSFTTLTFSTLALALAGLLAFYGIARRLGVSPMGALLGTGLLAFNPLFVHLSYSFMTDVPFLSLCLISCYFYLKGLHGGGGSMRRDLLWLLLGGAFAAWAFTIRQFGILVPIAFLLYLGYDALVARRWRPAHILALAAVPAVVLGVWFLMRMGIPPSDGALAASGRASTFLFKEVWPRVALMRVLMLLPIAALSVWAAVKLPRRRLWLAGLWAVLLITALYTVDFPKETWLQAGEPPFTATLGSLAVPLPNEPYTFGAVGNIIRVGGIDFFEYTQQPIWSPEAWRLLWIIGLGLGAVLLAGISSALFDWARDLARRLWRYRRTPPASSAMPLYLLGGMIFLVSVLFLGDSYDRYVFHFLPFLLLFLVRGSASWTRRGWTYSLVALALIASFTVLAKADNIDQNNARWTAANWLLSRSGGLHAGYDWDNWVGGRNDDYQVAGVALGGYRIERKFAYTCRLCGFEQRYVIAQSKASVPPLPLPHDGGAAPPSSP